MKRTKTKRSRRSNTRTNRKKLRGGCGCDRSILSGGSAGLAELPVRHYYDLADVTKNPAYMMKGGSKKRRMKGGMASFLLPGIVNNVMDQPILNGPVRYFV